MRLFFGVSLTDSDKNAIEYEVNRLKEKFEGKYTLNDNLHITLIYIGEVEPKVSYMLSQIGDKAFCDVNNFSIRAQNIRSFKDGKITYLAVDKDDRLISIYNSLKNLLDEAKVVYTLSDEYTPHITLRRGSKIVIEEDTRRYDLDISKVALFESKRVDGVLRYIPIKEWQL